MSRLDTIGRILLTLSESLRILPFLNVQVRFQEKYKVTGLCTQNAKFRTILLSSQRIPSSKQRKVQRISDKMHFSIFITLLPSVALALPNALPNQSPNPAILDVRGDVPAQGGGGLNLCWGCIEESSCTGNVKIKDLDMKNNPDVASTFSMWYDHFANDGYVASTRYQASLTDRSFSFRSIIGNGDAYDKGVCCNDWCVVLENTSQRTIKYAADQVSAKAIQFTDEGGCSSESAAPVPASAQFADSWH